MEWMIMPYKRYADFSGRSRRMEFWMFQLFMLIVYAVIIFVGGGLSSFDESGAGLGTSGILLIVFWLASIIPAIAVQVRRFHDQDKSGLLVLLNFVPFIGSLIVLVMMFLDGTPGPNQYGPDPKGRNDVAFGGTERVERPGGINMR